MSNFLVKFLTVATWLTLEEDNFLYQDRCQDQFSFKAYSAQTSIVVKYNCSNFRTSYKGTAKAVHGCFDCEHGQDEKRPKEEKKQKQCKTQRYR